MLSCSFSVLRMRNAVYLQEYVKKLRQEYESKGSHRVMQKPSIKAASALTSKTVKVAIRSLATLTADDILQAQML